VPVTGAYTHAPLLDLKLLNNGERTVFFTNAVLVVESSKVDPWPDLSVPYMVDLGFEDGFRIYNHGWGNVASCTVRFRVDSKDKEQPFDHEIELSAFEEESELVELKTRLAEELEEKQRAYLDGEIEFTGTDLDGGTRVDTRDLFIDVRFDDDSGVEEAFSEPTFEYEGQFDVARDSYEISIPISQYIRPDDPDRFTVLLTAEKSSVHRFRVKLIENSGKILQSEPLSMYVRVRRVRRRSS